MSADTFETIGSTLAWDSAANWSTGFVPQPGDDVTINAPSSGYSTVSIAATDPAYTVQSLSMKATGNNGRVDALDVEGNLTVTGTTTVTIAEINVQNGGHLALGAATLSTTGGISVGGPGTGTLTATSITGSGIADFIVYSGSATVGSIMGGCDVVLYTAGSLSVATTSGNNSFILQGGKLSLSTAAASLSDDVEVVKPSAVDLAAIPYQAGETVVLTPNISAYDLQTYTGTIRSALGVTLFTFNSLQPGHGSAPPVVSLSMDTQGGTLVSLACYTPGTLIGTPEGETRAGDLRIGDHVTVWGGGAQPIVWIGRRSYGGRLLARQPHLLPIRIQAGALGNGLPRRDLLVSPCHAMYLDGVLVPASGLVNGDTIRRESRAERVDYVHIELAEHTVIFAEGALSETFIDDDSRNVFHNAAEYRDLYGDASPPEPMYFAPRLTDGFAIEAIRLRLAPPPGQVRQAA